MYIGSMSTRLTYKNLPLAHEALRELAAGAAHVGKHYPALDLTDLCLKLSSELLANRSATPSGAFEWRIRRLLEQTAGVEPRRERRKRLAFTTLHFVER